jgi:hypothetical protein
MCNFWAAWFSAKFYFIFLTCTSKLILFYLFVKLAGQTSFADLEVIIVLTTVRSSLHQVPLQPSSWGKSLSLPPPFSAEGWWSRCGPTSDNSYPYLLSEPPPVILLQLGDMEMVRRMHGLLVWLCTSSKAASWQSEPAAGSKRSVVNRGSSTLEREHVPGGSSDEAVRQGLVLGSDSGGAWVLRRFCRRERDGGCWKYKKIIIWINLNQYLINHDYINNIWTNHANQ